MRTSRIVARGFPHLILQRGNYLQSVFQNESDYRRYLAWLKEYAGLSALKIWAYCLMENHVHLICVPPTRETLSKTLNTIHMRYAQYFNQKRKAYGHLWQGRFLSTILDEAHVYEAVRFVENNPVRAGLVEKAHLFPWSSARARVMKEDDGILSDPPFAIAERNDWEAYLRKPAREHLIENLKRNLTAGRPSGDAAFLGKMEILLARSLRIPPRGRPPKSPRPALEISE